MPKKVFVVEDNADHLEAILFVLEGLIIHDSLLECGSALIKDDYHLVIDDLELEFGNGDELVNHLCKHVEEFLPDLIALDQIMPIRGTEIYPKLREFYNKTIIFTTVALHDPEVENILKEAQNASILSKPFTARQLKKSVRNILSF